MAGDRGVSPVGAAFGVLLLGGVAVGSYLVMIGVVPVPSVGAGERVEASVEGRGELWRFVPPGDRVGFRLTGGAPVDGAGLEATVNGEVVGLCVARGPGCESVDQAGAIEPGEVVWAGCRAGSWAFYDGGARAVEEEVSSCR